MSTIIDHMTYEEIIQSAEDAKIEAIAIYTEAKVIHETIWTKRNSKRYNQLIKMAHTMSMRHADLRAMALRIKSSI